MLVTVDIDENDLRLSASGDESGDMHLAASVIEAIQEDYPEIYKKYFED